jgi:hypothetical protein
LTQIVVIRILIARGNSTFVFLKASRYNASYNNVSAYSRGQPASRQERPVPRTTASSARCKYGDGVHIVVDSSRDKADLKDGLFARTVLQVEIFPQFKVAHTTLFQDLRVVAPVSKSFTNAQEFACSYLIALLGEANWADLITLAVYGKYLRKINRVFMIRVIRLNKSGPWRALWI